MYSSYFLAVSRIKHMDKRYIAPKQVLGEVFKLPFGDKIVMSHWAKDRVYIEGVFGEPKSTFIDAYDKLTEAIKYGSILPPKIKVICVCKLEFEGSYLELEKIVGQLKNFA